MDLSRKAYMVQCTQHKIDEYTRAIEIATIPEIKAAYTTILAVHVSTMVAHKTEIAAMLSTVVGVPSAS
jgi:hypothetical protein